MFDQQLTFDGGAEDIAPAVRQDRLFSAPRTLRGQMALGQLGQLGQLEDCSVSAPAERRADD